MPATPFGTFTKTPVGAFMNTPTFVGEPPEPLRLGERGGAASVGKFTV